MISWWISGGRCGGVDSGGGDAAAEEGALRPGVSDEFGDLDVADGVCIARPERSCMAVKVG